MMCQTVKTIVNSDDVSDCQDYSKLYTHYNNYDKIEVLFMLGIIQKFAMNGRKWFIYINDIHLPAQNLYVLI